MSIIYLYLVKTMRTFFALKLVEVNSHENVTTRDLLEKNHSCRTIIANRKLLMKVYKSNRRNGKKSLCIKFNFFSLVYETLVCFD